MDRISSVTMIGLGAVGSFLAPRLQEAAGESGFQIIAQGERRERLLRRGTTINGRTYYFPVVAPQEQSQPSDLVIIAVKATALEEALEQIAGQVGPDTIIMSILNGVDSEEAAAQRYGMERVLYSFMRVSVVMKDGCCDYDPQKGKIFFGERNNASYSSRVLLVKELMDRAGIPYQIPEDMIHAIWHKFMSNIGENMTCALLGIPFGAFTSSHDADAIRLAAMEEVIAIAAKKGIHLGEEELAVQEKTIRAIPYQNKPSTLQDLEAGRKTEIELFSGQVIRMGRALGIPTPVNKLLYHGIKVLEQKNDGQFDVDQ